MFNPHPKTTPDFPTAIYVMPGSQRTFQLKFLGVVGEEKKRRKFTPPLSLQVYDEIPH